MNFKSIAKNYERLHKTRSFLVWSYGSNKIMSNVPSRSAVSEFLESKIGEIGGELRETPLLSIAEMKSQRVRGLPELGANASPFPALPPPSLDKTRDSRSKAREIAARAAKENKHAIFAAAQEAKKLALQANDKEDDDDGRLSSVPPDDEKIPPPLDGGANGGKSVEDQRLV